MNSQQGRYFTAGWLTQHEEQHRRRDLAHRKMPSRPLVQTPYMILLLAGQCLAEPLLQSIFMDHRPHPLQHSLWSCCGVPTGPELCLRQTGSKQHKQMPVR